MNIYTQFAASSDQIARALGGLAGTIFVAVMIVYVVNHIRAGKHQAPLGKGSVIGIVVSVLIFGAVSSLGSSGLLVDSKGWSKANKDSLLSSCIESAKATPVFAGGKGEKYCACTQKKVVEGIKYETIKKYYEANDTAGVEKVLAPYAEACITEL